MTEAAIKRFAREPTTEDIVVNTISQSVDRDFRLRPIAATVRLAALEHGELVEFCGEICQTQREAVQSAALSALKSLAD